MSVVAQYTHPQGSTIYVHDNGAIVKVNPQGKTVGTSATAEKLARGHGGWRLVTSGGTKGPEVGVPGTVTPVGAARSASQAAPTKIIAPMRFKEASLETLPAYTADDDWFAQQKLDGIRAQLVVEPGQDPWFRNSSGGRLAAATATATTDKILGYLGTHPADSAGYVVDGEVLGDSFYVFDIVLDGAEGVYLEDRLPALGLWHKSVVDAGLGDYIKLLPTAKTREQKEALCVAVYDGAGEGWIVKRRDSTYDWGQRVVHSLKIKVTHTVDAVVTDRNRDAQQNMVLGAWNAAGELVEIGCASAIGKPDAKIGEVVEVKYLYAGANGRLVQPTVIRKRDDKLFTDCSIDQLVFADKKVLEL